MKFELILLFATIVYQSQSLLVSSGHEIAKNVSACQSINQRPEITISPPVYTSNGYKIEEFGFTLTCKASYPIHWEFSGFPLKYVTVSRSRRFPQFNLKTNNDDSCYESILRVYDSDGTGNYSCINSLNTDSSKSSFYYKFYVESDSKLFNYKTKFGFSDWQTVNLAKKTNRNQFVIPCTSNYAKINSTLLKIKDTKEQVVHRSDLITYDPKVGFFLNATEFPDPVGVFKCLGTYGESEYRRDYVDEIKIVIRNTEGTVSFHPDTHMATFKNSTLRLFCESVDEVEFDTSKIRDTRIINQTKTNNPISHFNYSTTIFLESSGFSKGLVECKKTQTGVSIHVWSFNDGDKCQCLWKNWASDLTDKTYGVFICSTGVTSTRDNELVTCHNPSECKMKLSCRDEDNCGIKISPYFAYFGGLFEELSFGIFKCTAEDFSKTNMDYDELAGLHAEFHSQFDLITIESSDSSNGLLDLNNSKNFTCKINTFFLVEEIHWGLKMRNGTLLILDDFQDAEKYDRKTINPYRFEERKNIQIFDQDVEYVYCLSSTWDTGIIKTASVNVLVFVNGTTITQITESGNVAYGIPFATVFPWILSLNLVITIAFLVIYTRVLLKKLIHYEGSTAGAIEFSSVDKGSLNSVMSNDYYHVSSSTLELLANEK